MKKVLALLVLFTFAVAAQPNGSPNSGPKFAPGRLLVQSRSGVDDAAVDQALATHGAKRHAKIAQIGVHVLELPEAAVPHVQQALLKTGLFTFAERDAMAQGTAVPNDPQYGTQWHLPVIQAPSAWDLSTGSSGVTVAIIDSGIDPTHPDLAARLVPGVSYIGTSNTSDVLGHGTAVAGSAAAIGNNATGVAGVVWSNPIMPLVVLDATNWASYSNIASAITYAADHGARIMNISIGGTTSSSAMQSAVDYAWNKGAVVFASAGNSGSNQTQYPAACNHVVAVSATTSADTLASWSTFGNFVSLSAPGDSIWTTANGGGYRYASGTSFASPIAAGVGALVLSMKPSLSASALVSLLEQNSDDLGSGGYDQYYGYGRVNAFRAAQAVGNTTTDSQAPVSGISNPGNGSTVSATVTVQGSATDNVGVVKSELYIDNQLVASVASASIAYNWNTTNSSNGSHSLMMKAYDAAQNVGSTTDTVSVSNTVVSDTTPPNVSITSPGNGATVGNKPVKINVSASDNVGVTQVSIYIDGGMVYSGTAAPYVYGWNPRKASPGPHSVSATAWDAAGNNRSTGITVTK